MFVLSKTIVIKELIIIIIEHYSNTAVSTDVSESSVFLILALSGNSHPHKHDTIIYHTNTAAANKIDANGLNADTQTNRVDKNIIPVMRCIGTTKTLL